MGGILLDAVLKHDLVAPPHVFATVRQTSSERRSISSAQITLGTDNRAAAKDADVILLCVKPLAVSAVLDEIRPELNDQKLVISIAAAVSTEYMEKRSGGNVPVLRAMPNTPSMVDEGITAICKGKHATPKHLELARKLFDAVGKTVVIDEKHMDAVPGLSGSGPAFLYIIIEALAEAGVNVGLPRDIATQLAAQTTYGAARMVLENGYHPALLKDAGTTPAGCTVDGILELEEGGLRVTLIKAVKRATERARELANS